MEIFNAANYIINKKTVLLGYFFFTFSNISKKNNGLSSGVIATKKPATSKDAGVYEC